VGGGTCLRRPIRFFFAGPLVHSAQEDDSINQAIIDSRAAPAGGHQRWVLLEQQQQ
jgi:hypothetical protein